VRIVGLDLGGRRVGVAVSDRDGRMAVPERTLERVGDAAADRAALLATIEELGAERVVVGLPLQLDGRAGRAARAAAEEADSLALALAERGVEVETFDERLTTVSAERALAQGDRRRGRAGGQRRRRLVDSSAAAVMLQAWLDHRGRA
jgi:putative holliday junction resolvase